MPKKNDQVNHPAHYTKGKFETIDVIEDIVQHYSDPVEAFLVGQVLRYIARAPLKGTQKVDLEKGKWYLDRLVSR